MIKLIIKGKPITKKNSMRIVTNPRTGRVSLIPSKAFVDYQKVFLSQVRRPKQTIDQPVNVQAVYYMPTRHRVDITNPLSATHDLLVDAGVLEDDNSKIVVGVDGSRVLYDKENPRVEIVISKAMWTGEY
ncbi:RusA family crossover junction endodeoxyribonuclease [Jeotgalibaca porci]|uniref:RusA family crossover junction endodeoxyribonuclease n=1 Tax=Jeotgalibaca porci TaxID=1868793 RepID=UPI0035A0D07F